MCTAGKIVLQHSLCYSHHMDENTPKSKVIAVVGPTASGKTSLAIAIAEQFSGEVISADSRQVYRGMDIGTGKVTEAEKRGIPHHLLDIIDPMEVYTATDFTRDTTLAIADITKRAQLPIIAGGTFFYIDLLRGNLSPAPVPPNESFRASIAHYSNAELFSQLKGKDPRRANTIDANNRHRLMRALEIINTLGIVPESQPVESDFEWLLLGVDIPKETLHQNIHDRLQQRLATGLIEEVERLHTQGVTWQRMTEFGLEYRYITLYLQNQLAKQEMIEELETKIRQYAKRQMTWLKRDGAVNWHEPSDTQAIFARIETFLHPSII